MGSPRFLRVFFGSLSFLELQRTFWVKLGTCGLTWVSLGSHGFGGFPWVSLGFHGIYRFFEVPKDILGQIGYMWVLMGISGFSWVWWVPLGFLGFS